jgi:hypothetical protein
MSVLLPTVPKTQMLRMSSAAGRYIAKGAPVTKRFDATSIADSSTNASWRFLIDTEAHRKRVRCHRRRQINGHKDSISALGIFVSCRLVPVGIKPFRYGHHRAKNSAVATRTLTRRTISPAGVFGCEHNTSIAIQN